MTRRIEADLTDQEYDLLLLILGAGGGFATVNGFASVAALVLLTNKLFMGLPGFMPYIVEGGQMKQTTKQ